MKSFQYKIFAEAMPQMAFVSDPEGNIVYFNQRWYEYTGNLEGTEGWGWKDKPVHHPDDLQRTIERWKHSLQTGEPYEIEYRLRRFDGQYRWHLGKANPVRDEEGKIKLWMGTNTDIHTQKEAEEALKLEHQRLEGIIENMASGAVIMDPEGRMLSMNKAALEIHGFKNREDMYYHFDRFTEEFKLYYPDGSLIPVNDWPFNRAIRRDYIRDFEARLTWPKKNHERYISYTVVPVSENRNKIVNLIFTITDLSDRKKDEETLLEGEKRLRIASSAAGLGIFEWDLQSNACYWENDRMYEIMGRSKTEGNIPKEEFVEKVLHHDDREEFENALTEAFRSENQFKQIIRIWDADSMIRWLEFNGQVERKPDGSPKKVIGVVRDITHQRQLEENLKKEKELLQTIYNSIPVMLTIWDPRLNVLNFNKAFEQITGWTGEDNRKKSIMELVYPDPEYRRWVSDYMHSLAPGFKDMQMATRNGGKIESTWANVKISDGRYVGIGLDISERKAFEKQLSELSNQLQTVVDNIIDGVIMFGPDGDIIKINHAAMEMLPFLQNDKAPTAMFELHNSGGTLVTEDNWPKNRCLRGEHFMREEFCLKNVRENTYKYLEFSGIPVYEKDDILFAVITVNDISDRKNEQIRIRKANSTLKEKNMQLEKMGKLHENLLYIIAHDLRGPITSMSLILEILKGEKVPEQNTEMIRSLQGMLKRQKNIINGLVEIIHIETPEMIKVGKILLGHIIRDILKEFEASLNKSDGTVEVDFRKAESVIYVQSFLYSILKNLISNAIKYRNNKNPLRIIIKSSRKDGFLLISVKDNGKGFDLKKTRNELFKPFKRFSKGSEGSGIGLYLIKSLIEKNGGYIEVKSKPGDGTEFLCYFREYEITTAETVSESTIG